MRRLILAVVAAALLVLVLPLPAGATGAAFCMNGPGRTCTLGTLIVGTLRATTVDAGAANLNALTVNGDAGIAGNVGIGGSLDAGAVVTPSVSGAGTGVLDLNSSVASGTTAFTHDATVNLTSGNHSCWRDTGTTTLMCLTFDGIPVTQAGGAQSKVRGIILLSGGTGTATVGTGCFATCQNQTTIAPVRCTVSGTTLTADAVLDDTVSYHCDY